MPRLPTNSTDPSADSATASGSLKLADVAGTSRAPMLLLPARERGRGRRLAAGGRVGEQLANGSWKGVVVGVGVGVGVGVRVAA